MTSSRRGPLPWSVLTTMDCAEEHDSELLHVVTVPESVEEYPDADKEHLWLEHEDACFGQVFEDYVGGPYESSGSDVYTFRPTERAWADEDRTVQCVVYSLEGEPFHRRRPGHPLRAAGRPALRCA